jgi:3'-phosphoadenosine 5'-phosphosulfate sulfotransferase (PAPS reductase)/FAD synthetase
MENIVSFSGGKDSTAMLLRMVELNMPIDKVVFADTTLEFPEMYDYIKKIKSLIPYKIIIVKAVHSWDDWFYGCWSKGKNTGVIRGFPYVTRMCWWQRDSKDVPLAKICKGNINYIGIAKDEEKRCDREVYKKGIFKFPLVEWGWTENDCIQYLKKRGLLNPLYKKFKRLGCWLCPKQSMSSLKSLYLYYPALWEKLKKYEKDSPQGFKPDVKLKDLEIKWKNQTKLWPRSKGLNSIKSKKLV